jgi:predicted RNA-binding protein (virulence factor B family)
LIAAAAACYAVRGSWPEQNTVDVQEVKKLDVYLKKLFGNAHIRVVPRPKKDDSAEVYVGDEFVGVLFVDDDDEERSYNFQMAILGSDLE